MSKRLRSECDGCSDNSCCSLNKEEKEKEKSLPSGLAPTAPTAPTAPLGPLVYVEPSAFCPVCDEEMDYCSQACGPCVRNGSLMEWAGYVRRTHSIEPIPPEPTMIDDEPDDYEDSFFDEDSALYK